MDGELRDRWREWRRWGDSRHQALYMASGIRAGLLTREHVALCAFLKHRASRLLGESMKMVKPRGVVWNNKLIPNIEINETIRGLTNWNLEAQNYAALGVMQLIGSQLAQGSHTRRTNEIIERAEEICRGKPAQMGRLLRREPSRWYNRQENLRLALHGIANRLVIKRSPTPTLVTAAAFITDRMVESALAEHLVPWALGDFA